MKRRLMILGAGAFSLHTFAAKQPNIIYIMTDQHTATALSCSGNFDLKTPHLDRLAAAGMLFNNAYCASPLSGPARSAMFTGMMPCQIGTEKNGAPLTADLIPNSLGWLMQNAGYDCAYGGKWHVHTASIPDSVFGFEHLHDHNDYGLAESCVAYLQRDHEKPFFLVASFDNPHNICEYARSQNLPFMDYEEPKLEDCPTLPHNFYPNPYDASILKHEQSLSYKLYPTVDYSRDDWRRYLHAYYRMIEHVDGEIGKIVDELDRQNLWDNTVVIFTSDHGDGAAAHQWNQKTVLYQEVANVPFIVTLPGKKHAGTKMPQLINNGPDLMPTLCEWAGADLPEGRQGISFKKLVEKGDPESDHQDYIVTETTFNQTSGTLGWMVRTDRFKYVLYDKGLNREQLYDLTTDPGEMRNLAVEKRYAHIVKEHQEYLKEWMQRHKTKGVKVQTNFIPR